jgi:hypothetical protein
VGVLKPCLLTRISCYLAIAWLIRKYFVMRYNNCRVTGDKYNPDVILARELESSLSLGLRIRH